MKKEVLFHEPPKNYPKQSAHHILPPSGQGNRVLAHKAAGLESKGNNLPSQHSLPEGSTKCSKRSETESIACDDIEKKDFNKAHFALPSDERFCLATQEGAERVEKEDASRRIYHKKTRSKTSLRLSCRWTSRRDIYRRTVHHGRHRHYNHRQE